MFLVNETDTFLVCKPMIAVVWAGMLEYHCSEHHSTFVADFRHSHQANQSMPATVLSSKMNTDFAGRLMNLFAMARGVNRGWLEHGKYIDSIRTCAMLQTMKSESVQ